MRVKTLGLLFGVPMFLALAGCAGVGSVTAADKLEDLRDLEDVRRDVEVVGCVSLTRMETAVIYDSCELAAVASPELAIDLSFVGFEIAIPKNGTACMRVRGEYIAFGPETVSIGVFHGAHGHLLASEAEIVPCN